MPFAKQQFKGNDNPINGEASISSFDMKAKDFIFEVGDKRFPMRRLMGEFNSLVASIEPEEVLFDLRAAPKV